VQMTRLVKFYNLRFKIGFKIFFEEMTGIRSLVPAIFIENSEVVLEDFNQFCFFYMVLQMIANGASCQELRIAPKNRFRTNFFGQNYVLITSYFHPRNLPVLHKMY
jgi:hypothetical protein